jgi:hypothetical protein
MRSVLIVARVEALAGLCWICHQSISSVI